MPFARVAGTGYYVPPRLVTNHDLMRYYDTTEEWIVERSGIHERHFAEPGTGPADLAVSAVEMALADAGLTPAEVDMIVFATLSPEYYFPGSGCLLQRKLPFRNIPALDIRMQCSGFIYGLSIAQMYVQQGMYRHVLVVGAEVQSTSIDFSPEGRTVGVIFGDGAGAAVVSATHEPVGILSTHLYSDGKYAEELTIQEPTSLYPGKVGHLPLGTKPHMNGREVFRHAVTRMTEVAREAMQAQGWQPGDVARFIPHQANKRIAQSVAEQLSLAEDKFYINIQKYGNTTAASIPIALAEAARDGSVQRGDKLVLMAFGSGFTWGSAAVIY
ncbi:MAG: ketoacyl-ACP synthase III [Bacteroidetes bacterium]|nr:ketoacyl-ACP synthase III [Bacteroidota bacterium]